MTVIKTDGLYRCKLFAITTKDRLNKTPPAAPLVSLAEDGKSIIVDLPNESGRRPVVDAGLYSDIVIQIDAARDSTRRLSLRYILQWDDGVMETAGRTEFVRFSRFGV